MAKIACCHNCAYSYWDREHTLECMEVGVMNWPACANHPESPGRMRRMPERGMCPNYRPRPATPEGEVKQIPLGGGIFAYVDAADFEWLNPWTWSLVGAYVGRYEKGKLILMHRQIMQPPTGMIVDHKNRNKLDNTRVNLRVCTHQENAFNRGKRRGTSSRFRGVSRRKKSGKYHAQICYEGEQRFLGLFTDEVEAARAHDYRAVELFGASARLNFPDEWPPQRRAEICAQRDAAIKEGKRTRKKEGKTRGRSYPRVTGHGSRATPPKRPRRTTRDAKRSTRSKRATVRKRAAARKPRRTTGK